MNRLPLLTEHLDITAAYGCSLLREEGWVVSLLECTICYLASIMDLSNCNTGL